MRCDICCIDLCKKCVNFQNEAIKNTEDDKAVVSQGRKATWSKAISRTLVTILILEYLHSIFNYILLYSLDGQELGRFLTTACLSVLTGASLVNFYRIDNKDILTE